MEITAVLRRALGGATMTALVLAASAHALAATPLPCPRKGAEVIASDKLVRVYRYPLTKERYPPPRRAEACVVRGGARMTLFDPNRPSTGLPHRGFGVVAISGTVVAYAVSQFGVDSGGSDLFLADVASRRILRELPGGGFVDAGFLSRTRITDFVLSPSGSAAWIDEVVRPPKKVKTFVVGAAPLGRPEAVLDEGPGIGAGSLTLTHGTLMWWDGGVERSAPLHP